MSEGANGFRQRAEQVSAELARVRDELGVQLHLAGQEAKDAWHRLGPQLERAQARLAAAVQGVARGLHDEQASLEAHLALMDARDRLRELQPSLQALRQRIQQAGAGALAALPDQLKLEATLAAMDLSDALERRRGAAREGLREARDFGRQLVAEIEGLLAGVRGPSDR